MLMRHRCVAVVWCLLVLGVMPPSVMAHPYHVSVAEVEWNPDHSVFEVALKLLPEDLEDALGAVAGQRVNLDAPGMDALIRSYLQDRIGVRNQDGEQGELKWVGKEVSYRAAWLYFEITAPAGDALWLYNRILFERHPQQINTLLYRHNKRSQSINLTAAKGNGQYRITHPASETARH